MRQSKLFTKTLREASSDETASNAQLLIRGGFAYKNSAGIYTMLPLGWRVIQNIARIIREEMDAIGGQELYMPALVERRYLDATNRWDVEIGFEACGKADKKAAFALGWTHEEVVTEIASKYISSYKDMPFAAYQIQTKFRNEARAKSGLLRGREFLMKDLYSFHASQEDFERYYQAVRGAYEKIFTRCGLKAIYTVAAGGAFTAAHTHEFQVISPVGEDTIFICGSCAYAENSEIAKLASGAICPQCGGTVHEEKSIEVGNIFPLGVKYTEAFNVTYLDEKGSKHPVIMGSYGIGIGRVMATIVEVSHDDKGIRWPKNIAPFNVHMIELLPKDEAKRAAVRSAAETLYADLTRAGISVLYDEREGLSAGEKFADCDLIGIPVRLVISEKTIAQDSVEVKYRVKDSADLVKRADIVAHCAR
ncbi:MAG: aminoacyl--tRNA ligase-related protein [bacterium]|nr:aminoacyl--tRNA ligase-related protein [bacterium]